MEAVLSRCVRELPEDVRARLRRLFTELAIVLLGTVEETHIQKLLCAATLTRDGAKLDISPMIELFDFRIYKYGPYDPEVTKCLRDITDVKVQVHDEDTVELYLEHVRLSRQEIEREIHILCAAHGISEVCEDFIERLNKLAREHRVDIRDVVYELLGLDDDKKVLLSNVPLKILLKLVGLYPGVNIEEALREVLGDRLYRKLQEIKKEARELGIAPDRLEVEPLS